MFRFHIVLLAAIHASAAQAQTLTATRADKNHAIVIDGNLDDLSWAAAPAFKGFVEFEPSNGKNAPASLRTSARLLIDDQALVFGIHAWDASPASMQGSLARRDKVGTEQDFIGIWIDPTGQGQSPSLSA